jgi:hypothetical protein
VGSRRPYFADSFIRPLPNVPFVGTDKSGLRTARFGPYLYNRSRRTLIRVGGSAVRPIILPVASAYFYPCLSPVRAGPQYFSGMVSTVYCVSTHFRGLNVRQRKFCPPLYRVVGATRVTRYTAELTRLGF